MTLKQYLEKQIHHYAKAKQEAKYADFEYHVFEGRIRAYTDIILACPDEVLNKKITNEVW